MIRTAAALLAVWMACPIATAEVEPGIESLEWLAGCWRSEGAGRLSEECWLPPRSRVMLGVNRSSGGDRYAFEFLRIAQDDDGFALWASPSGAQAVPFMVSEISERRVVFTNPEHDFPQRITYRLEGERLHARVEARSNGGWDGFELVWERAADGWCRAASSAGD